MGIKLKPLRSNAMKCKQSKHTTIEAGMKVVEENECMIQAKPCMRISKGKNQELASRSQTWVG